MILLIYILTLFSFSQEKFMVMTSSEQLLSASERYCLSVIGTIEATGNNDGVIIENIIKTGGGLKGYPYCYYYQYWAYEMATKEINQNSCVQVKNPMVKSGSSQAMFDYAKKLNKKVPYQVAKHDLIVWKSAKSWSGHIERVKKVLGGGYVMTYAGNTSNGLSGDQREGNGIFIRKRNINHPLSRILKIRGLVGYEWL